MRVIQRQLQQLVRLVDDLLDATRMSSNKIQIRKSRIDLVPIVHYAAEVAKPEIEAARQMLTIRVPQEPVWLDADPDRVAQVLSNLLNNASRYTPVGGRIAVAVAVDGVDAVLSVSDTLHVAKLGADSCGWEGAAPAGCDRRAAATARGLHMDR